MREKSLQKNDILDELSVGVLCCREKDRAMWSLARRRGSVVLIATSSFMAGYFLNRHSLKRVNAASVQV